MAGPCVIESEALCLDIASHLKQICAELGLNYVFKASLDKANRTSLDSFRGPGFEAGLPILETVRKTLDVPVVTDVHEVHQVEAAARVVDVIQIPSRSLSRQTDLLLEAGRSGKAVNIKKGQFLSPGQIRPQVEKVLSTGNTRVMVSERGSQLRLRESRGRHAHPRAHSRARCSGDLRRDPLGAASRWKRSRDGRRAPASCPC